VKFKITSILKNRYIIILTLFTIWILFFDSNSTLVHIELNEKIENLENEAKYYKTEIKKDESELSKIQTDSGLEKYAREELYMKKENEDIYIIEYDTIK
jgi:cell division protein FtsB